MDTISDAKFVGAEIALLAVTWFGSVQAWLQSAYWPPIALLCIWWIVAFFRLSLVEMLVRRRYVNNLDPALFNISAAREIAKGKAVAKKYLLGGVLLLGGLAASVIASEDVPPNLWQFLTYIGTTLVAANCGWAIHRRFQLSTDAAALLKYKALLSEDLPPFMKKLSNIEEIANLDDAPEPDR